MNKLSQTEASKASVFSFAGIARYTILLLLFLSIGMQFFSVPTEWTLSLVIVLTIILWATQLLAPWLVSLVFISTVLMGSMVPPALALQGFLASGTWLLFAGMIIGLALKHTGLASDVAFRVSPLLKGGFAKSLAGFMLIGSTLVFLMPSAMGRIVLLMPIFKALSDQLGYEEKSEASMHLILGGVFATHLSAYAVLPANTPNNVLLGATERFLGVNISYLEYFVLHFPVLGALKLLLIFVVLWFPMRKIESPKTHSTHINLETSGASKLAKKELAVIIAIMLGLWFTQSFHHLPTAWVALFAAVLTLLPCFHVLPEKPIEKLNFSTMFYVAGIVSLGVVANKSSLLVIIKDAITQLLHASNLSSFSSFFVLSFLANTSSLLLTVPSVPAVLTPLSESLASTLHLPLDTVYMTQVVGMSCVWLPFQAPPLVLAKSLSSITWKKLTRYTVLISVLSILLLWPSDYVWWSFLGKFN